MPPRPVLSCRLVLGLFGFVPTGMDAQLTAHSPFLPPPGAVDAPRPEVKLEFDGYLSGPRGLEFVVHDKAHKTRAWLALNQRNADLDLVAKHYDTMNETLIVEQRGGVQVLPLRRARIVSTGMNAAFRPPTAMPAAPRVTAAAVEAQLRLEQTMAEIQKRRALREQAALSVSPAAIPATVGSPVESSSRAAAPSAGNSVPTIRQ